MSRAISRAETWERTYEAFQQINFTSFDYNTIKRSLVQYIKLYYPEDFNDIIESSEFIALIETFAYVGELLAYRLDINAHENFLSTAQRKESVLRLAKLISYKANRNMPARGLVKLTSVRTSELIFDSKGRSLQNRNIVWNDATNPDWKEQFYLVMNHVLDQRIGSIAPNERVQIQDVLFELYRFKNNTLRYGVLPFTVSVSNQQHIFELVPVELSESDFKEKRPEYDTSFSLLYGSDGLGDQSDYTGFFLYAKQGRIFSNRFVFDGQTPNQTITIPQDNINEIDVWVQEVDPDTNKIMISDSDSDFRSGEWFEVDLAHAQNIIFNNKENRKKYEIETLSNDQIRIIFGDGDFAEIPGGTFDVWYRVSDADPIVYPKTLIQDGSTSFTYQDTNNNTQVFSFNFSLVNSLQNASPSEDIEHIRNLAPSVYYTQDRMVNGRDYNTFMLQDNSIIKLRSVNRTFAGDSKYIAWHDPKEYYENVKMVGDDLAIYYFVGTITYPNIPNVFTAEEILTLYIEPTLSSIEFFNILTSPPFNKHPSVIRHKFSTAPFNFINGGPYEYTLSEKTMILNELNSSSKEEFDIYYSGVFDQWTVGKHPDDPSSEQMITMIPIYNGSSFNGWQQINKIKRIITHSESLKFWHENSGKTLISYDSLKSVKDSISILKANENSDRTGLLKSNMNFDVISYVPYTEGPTYTGVTNVHELNVVSSDENQDGIPDNLILEQLIDKKIGLVQTSNFYLPLIVELPTNVLYERVEEEINISIKNRNGRTPLLKHANWTAVKNENNPTLTNIIVINSVEPEFETTGDIIEIVIKDFVYFKRNLEYNWVPVEKTDSILVEWDQQRDNNLLDATLKRESGRYPLNFFWMHYSPSYNLIDPSTSNIIDTFVVTRGYYQLFQQWLTDETGLVKYPDAITPQALRSSYNYLLENKMISDSVVLHPGKIKILFGSYASPELQCTFKVIRSPNKVLSDNQVRVKIVDVIRQFFYIDNVEFGETFYFTELATAIHNSLPTEIDSVVLVPKQQNNYFGDMFQVYSREDEILQPHIMVENIEIVDFYTASNLKQVTSP